jgi:predicted aminopeptidase
MRRFARLLLRLAALLVIALILFAALTPMGRYLVRGAIAESKILLSRRPIPELVGDASVDARTRGKLALVLEARAFAADSLGLDAGESFTTYAPLERDTLVLVVSAAKRDELTLHRWWFPIVGRVPYKGFFDFPRALRTAAEMREEGYDTYVRPASAFSTLGWFNDPLVSTTLRLDSAALANTVIHELTHNTFYARGQAIFNESFASFVGARGAERFFRARGDSALVRRVLDDWEDDKLLGRFYTGLYATLDSAFKAHPDDRDARLRAREAIYAEARRQLRTGIGPRLNTWPPGLLDRIQLDNAALLARRIYVTDLELFDEVYEREGRDLERARARIISLAKSRPEAPFEALRGWLAASSLGIRKTSSRG